MQRRADEQRRSDTDRNSADNGRKKQVVQRWRGTGGNITAAWLKENTRSRQPMNRRGRKTTAEGGLHLCPRERVLKRTQSKSYKFYKACRWDKWWEEFLTARKPDGGMVYRTSWSFARVKAKTEEQRKIIYQAIGPKSIQLSGSQKKRVHVPYLGDWQQLRAKAYFYDKESIETMRVIVAERLDALEAGRGAATIVLELIAKWMKYDEAIDAAFNYSPVDEKGTDLKAKAVRAGIFLKIKTQTAQVLMQLVGKYLQCHGIGSDEISEFGQLVLAISRQAARITPK
jgi:hypothetical protein